jgi:hypothetical protein
MMGAYTVEILIAWIGEYIVLWKYEVKFITNKLATLSK